jgi:hypothetical protein
MSPVVMAASIGGKSKLTGTAALKATNFDKFASGKKTELLKAH